MVVDYKTLHITRFQGKGFCEATYKQFLEDIESLSHNSHADPVQIYKFVNYSNVYFDRYLTLDANFSSLDELRVFRKFLKTIQEYKDSPSKYLDLLMQCTELLKFETFDFYSYVTSWTTPKYGDFTLILSKIKGLISNKRNSGSSLRSALFNFSVKAKVLCFSFPKPHGTKYSSLESIFVEIKKPWIRLIGEVLNEETRFRTSIS